MRTTFRAQFIVLIVLGLAVTRGYGVPSFARQTGLSCNVCHRNPPELTSFGRLFKLRGYSVSNGAGSDKIGTSPDLSLSKIIPVSAMILLSNTTTQATQPGTQNAANGFPQQASIFLAGSFAPHFGGFTQVTYSHVDDHFSMDNADLRFANHGKLFGSGIDYGVTLNNNPTVEDLWNSTPAWGFPWISSEAGVGSNASSLIDGGLAQDVAGAGVYSLWKNHLYTDVTVYRSEHAGSSAPSDGSGYAFNIKGVAPYWRAAWQQSWGSNYLEFGTFGMYVNSTPGGVSGATDRYVDTGVDFQYQRPIGRDELDLHGSYVREKSNLGASLQAESAGFTAHHLNVFKADAVYHWTHKYSATGAVFSTTGTADDVLFGGDPVTGSANGSPSTNGYIAQLAYWPWQNVDLNVNYTGYRKFNGATTNYDGANRNASDNSSVFVALWVSF